MPSGWHHTVENLTDTLSVNHNWFNAHNVHWAWVLLRRQRGLAAQGIEDCRWAGRAACGARTPKYRACICTDTGYAAVPGAMC